MLSQALRSTLFVLAGLLAAATVSFMLAGGATSAYGQDQYVGDDGTLLESGTGVISGRVLDEDGNSLYGYVSVCRISDDKCKGTWPDATSGAYAFSNLPEGEYTVTAYPPSDSSVTAKRIGPLTLTDGQTLADQDIVLVVPPPPTPPPAGTSFGNTPEGEIPVVIVGEMNHLETTGCVGGTATYKVTGLYGDSFGGPMTEGPETGTYTADFQIPFTGTAEIAITIIDCPEGTADQTIEFNIYIDPSGYVRDTNGDPIPGATVKLYRSETASGQFELVPDGSAIMSPSNRTNPDRTDSTGHFGWDVIPGYYKVSAENEGCVDPDDSTKTAVESRVMEIPPPVFDLDLRLDCSVRYDFEGFFSPVNNPDVLNKAKAGSAIPVKFSLGGDKGLDVFYTEKKDDGTTVSYPSWATMDCGSTDSVDPIEQAVSAGSSGLSYDSSTQRYTYVWKTSKDWAGSCKQLVVKLKDGTEHRAFFQLTKP